jgi:hypothetical protein
LGESVSIPWILYNDNISFFSPRTPRLRVSYHSSSSKSCLNRERLPKDKIIVYWFNHANDEDAPGQRLLAKVGTFNKDRTKINWGGKETLVELAGSPAPVRRRCRTFDPDLIAEAGIQAWPRVINGRFYVTGFLNVCQGVGRRDANTDQGAAAGTRWLTVAGA